MKTIASKPKTSIRYTDEVKNEVRDFVHAHNKENKRGGVTAASKKYKITAVTISNWLKGSKKTKAKAVVAAAPTAEVAKSAVAAKPAVRRGRKPAAASAAASGGARSTLNRMLAIQDQIASLNSEYESLRGQL